MPSRTSPAPNDDFHVDLLSHCARHSPEVVIYTAVIVGSQESFRASLGDKVYQRSRAGLQAANNASSLLRFARMLKPALVVHGEISGIVPQQKHRHTNTYLCRHHLAVIGVHDSCHSPFQIHARSVEHTDGARSAVMGAPRCIIVALKCMSCYTNFGEARSRNLTV